MVGRTVVIGDPCPWVAQSAEAFLSKIFACSYSIAGLNVLSGNPADHLVHRHTHRVVRGSLLVCGRPDGRLTALTTLEASTCLAVNQASSIQSLGGTCESITIGHNMSKLPLTKKAIFLETHRPRFLCEKVLGDADEGNLDESSHPMRGLTRSFAVRNLIAPKPLSRQQSFRTRTAPKPMNMTATGNLKSSQTSFLSTSMPSQRSDLDGDSTSAGKLSDESSHSTSAILRLHTSSSAGGRLKKFKALRRASDASIKAIRRASDASIESSSERETRSSAGLIGRFLAVAACYSTTQRTYFCFNRRLCQP